MKSPLYRIFLLAIGAFLGFAAGRATAPKTAQAAVSVDCYDSAGHLVKGAFFSKFGGVQTSCAAGQIAVPHH